MRICCPALWSATIVFKCVLYIFFLYQRLWSPRALRSILAVLSNVLFWTEISNVVPGVCCSHQSSLRVIVPSAPIITGTTAAFTHHIFSCSSFSPWYFSSFSCSFFLPSLLCCLSVQLFPAADMFFQCQSPLQFDSGTCHAEAYPSMITDQVPPPCWVSVA